MIAHIDQHFSPSGAVDSFGYIFDLINIKQLDQELVIMLKACFSNGIQQPENGGYSY
jgi:hypothetical protein